MIKPTAIIAIFLASTLLCARMVTAQDVPSGACMIPSGDWCWPIAPLTYGDICDCPLPDGGLQEGVVQ